MRSTVALTVIALLAVTFAALLESGCPPDTDGASKVLLKALSGGCAGCAPRARQEKVILLPGGVPLVLVWIPPGTFQMGRYPGETGSSSKEDPKHQVSVPGFWMGKYEVTQQQWLAVRSTWPGPAPSEQEGLGGDHSAYYISWNDAQHFAASLNTHLVNTGQGFLRVRLPVEAEWEYACRAGTQTRFYWGDDPGETKIGDYAWFNDNSTAPYTKPVGLKLPNAFGLHDMGGNVMEWCEDDYHMDYTGAPNYGGAWVDAPRGAQRVARGGSSISHFVWIRSAARLAHNPNIHYAGLGFRLAAD